ncbi:MAG: DNA mismatch repair endonuclease MutL, partial [Firmicutes bacterium]|nr:DNA mismatch repair endonuclease MutL [Bacillota bacterium]
MTLINILAPDVVEQIAAGEVVENPASVVKELVENSLDAGATLVEVRIRESGLEEIRVTDDGTGIHPGEIGHAFRRHSTSKISTADDLEHLDTLGFRGEALASISAVSRVTLTSRPPDELGGMRIELAGGKKQSEEEVGAPVGTDIVVSDLFYNTPARKAFLKSPSYEARRISLLLTGLAFSFPDVAFSFWHGERLIFQTRGDGDVLEIIAEAYGKDVPRSMLKLQHEQRGTISIGGYISTPLLTRSTRQYQTFLVNRRLIRSNLLSGTLKRGYRGLIPGQRFPLAVIHLQLPPEKVDVNIHPAKAEVRFHHDREITGLIFRAVGETLKRTSPSIALGSGDFARKRSFEAQPTDFPPGDEKTEQKNRTYYLQDEMIADNFHPDDFNKKTIISTPEESGQIFPGEDYQVIGQYLSSYILAQKGDKLLLIDQHAAHERVLYEHYRKKYSEAEHDSQVLASPISIEIPASLAENMPAFISLMENAGFKIELFGENTYLVREIPLILADIFNQEIFLDLLEYIGEHKEIPGSDANEPIIRMMACKNAVKANQKMSLPEIRKLIEELGMTATPFYCPHG